MKGETYDGEWKNDLRDGKGRNLYIIGYFKSSNGESYDGDWEHDKISGEGLLLIMHRNIHKCSRRKIRRKYEK